MGCKRTIFTVLLSDEVEEIGVHVDWDANVALTPEMLTGLNCPPQMSIVRKGRLLAPLVFGQQTIPEGYAVFMDNFGVYYLES